MISVIIPVYNVESFLVRCLDSVLAQPEATQILLVDDGSTDGSGVICDRYACQDSRVQVIHKANGGLSSARNAGLDVADREYVAFVDSDDYLQPNAYREMLGCARKWDADLVYAGRYDVDGDTAEKTLGLCPKREEALSGEEAVGRIFTWDNVDSAAWDKLYRRTLFQGIRYPLGKICEDVPTTYRLCLRANRVVALPVPIYNYCHRSGSITTAPASEKSFHFAAHTQQICRDIRENHPSLLPQARYLRVRSLVHPMQLCILTGQKQVLRQQYAACKRELRKGTGFILQSGMFSGKEKQHALLLVLGLYGIAWKLYCIRKG